MKKKSKKDCRGFTWTGFVKAVNQITPKDMTVYSGNFVMELVLPNALRITSFGKIKSRLDSYIKSHGGKIPDYIKITIRQMNQFVDLHPESHRVVNKYNRPMSFNGIPMYAIRPNLNP